MTFIQVFLTRNFHNKKTTSFLKWFYKYLFSKRQTIRLTLNQRRFISGVVFCIHPEVLLPKALSNPDRQDLYFPVHRKALAAPYSDINFLPFIYPGFSPLGSLFIVSSNALPKFLQS